MTTCITVLIAVGLANVALHDRPSEAASVDGTQSSLSRVESEVFEAVAYDAVSILRFAHHKKCHT